MSAFNSIRISVAGISAIIILALFLQMGSSIASASSLDEGWSTKVIDPDIFVWGEGGWWMSGSSIAVDAEYHAHIVYIVGNGGAQFLGYANNTDGDWSFSIIDGPFYFVYQVSIDLDSHENAHIAYVTNDEAWGSTVRFATNAGQPIGQWSLINVSSGPGIYGGCSIALSSTDIVHLAYTSSNGVMLASKAPSEPFDIELAADPWPYSSYFYDVSVDISSTGVPHILFVNTSTGESILSHAWKDGPEWRDEVVNSTLDTWQSSLSIDDMDALHIAFRCTEENYTNPRVYYSMKDAGGWSSATKIDDVQDWDEVSIKAVGDSDVHIVYSLSNWSAPEPGLHYLHIYPDGSTSSAWLTKDSLGEEADVAVDPSGQAHASFIVGMDLYYGTNGPVPSEPYNLVAIPGGARITLAWDEPNSTSNLTGYQIYYSLFSDFYEGFTTVVNVSKTNTSHTIMGLTNYETYFFKVKATNGYADGLFSKTVAATPWPPNEPPTAPSWSAVYAGIRNVTLFWNPPSFSNGSMVSNYSIAWGFSPDNMTNEIGLGPFSGIVHDGLTSGQTYYYKIKAKNVAGWGPYSEVVSAIPEFPPNVPSAPRNLIAMDGLGNITLTWDAPLYSNASSVVGYMISYGTSPDSMPSQITTDQLEYSLEGLTKGQTYYLKVAAQNSAGYGPNSGIESATPFGVPSTPIGLTAEAGDGYLQLSWGAPSYMGPGTLTYHVFRNDSLSWSGTLPAHNDTNVVNGVTYVYKVVAQNNLGWGENSSSISAMPRGVPNAPLELQVRVGAKFVNLSWSQPFSDGGSPIISYTILRNPSPSPAIPWVIDASSGVTWYNDTTVEPGTGYTYYVLASNQIGSGEGSEITITTLAEPPSNDNDWIFYLAIIGIVALAVIAIAIIVLKRRRM